MSESMINSIVLAPQQELLQNVAKWRHGIEKISYKWKGKVRTRRTTCRVRILQGTSRAEHKLECFEWTAFNFTHLTTSVLGTGLCVSLSSVSLLAWSARQVIANLIN